MAVMMVVAMRMGVSVICAAHRLERLAHLTHCRAQSAEHRLDDVVALDQDAARLDLGRQMPVADMPGESQERFGALGADLQKRFLGRDHLGVTAVVEDQPVAMGEGDRIRQIDEYLIAVLKGEHLAAQMTLVMGEHDDIEWGWPRP
jgi:hypothetical protein